MPPNDVPVPKPDDDTAELLSLMNGSVAGSGMLLYDRFADRVHDFVLFLTRDAGLAAEITRDVIVMTANSPTSFSTAPQLRSWLYARARDETFALLGVRGRAPAEDRVIPLDPLPADHTSADLANLVYEATAAFSERDLALLTLHLRHGLEGEALGEAMGLSQSAVDVLLPATLERVDVQTTALVLLAAGATAAAGGGLAELQDGWDGTFSPLIRRRAVELSDELEEVGAGLSSPLDLLRQIPPSPAPATLREAVEGRLWLTGSMSLGNTSAPLVSGVLTDPTVPPGTAAADIASEDHTLPPGTVPPVVDPVEAPGPVDAGPSPALGGSATETVARGAEDPGVAPPTDAPVRRRIPRSFAVALGTAVALVVAAGLLRFVAGPEALPGDDVVSLTTPPSLTVEGTGTPAVGPGPDPADVGPDAALLDVAAASQVGSTGPGPGVGTPRPGNLSVPATPIVLRAGDTASLRLTNSGGAEVRFSILDAPAWLTVSTAEGRVDGGAVTEVLLALAPSLPEGDYRMSLPVRWEGSDAAGTVIAEVQGANDRDPVPQDVQVGARALLAEGCGLDSTEVAVTVLDESALGEVAVSATPAGGSVSIRFTLDPDPRQPGRFVGVVGPFDRGGTLDLRVEATDVRGNSTDVDAGQITIAPCPG